MYMDKSRNSYYGIAERDYFSAKSLLDSDQSEYFYNNIASLSSQAAEKFMKAVLNEYDLDNPKIMELMRAHNLRLLLKRIKELFPACDLNVNDYKSLGDYYFDARYPSDNFEEVDKESAEKCIELLKELIQFVDSLGD